MASQSVPALPAPEAEYHCDQLRDVQSRICNFSLARVEMRHYKRLKLDAQEVVLNRRGRPSPHFPFFAPYQGPMPSVDEARMEMDFLDYDKPTRVPLTAMGHARVLTRYFHGYTSLCREDGLELWSLKG